VAVGCVSRVGVGDDAPSGPVVGSGVAPPGTVALVGAAMPVGDGVSADAAGPGLAVPSTGAMVPGKGAVEAMTGSPASSGATPGTAAPFGTGVLVGTSAIPGAAVAVKVGLSVLAGEGGSSSRREMNVLVVQARRPAIMATAASRTAHCFLAFVFIPPGAFVGLGTKPCTGPAWPRCSSVGPSPRRLFRPGGRASRGARLPPPDAIIPQTAAWGQSPLATCHGCSEVRACPRTGNRGRSTSLESS
jgi:hypothetical protein